MTVQLEPTLTPASLFVPSTGCPLYSKVLAGIPGLTDLLVKLRRQLIVISGSVDVTVILAQPDP